MTQTGIVAVGVQSSAQPVASDLAQPCVAVPLAVDAIAVELVGEIGVDVGVRRRS